MAVKIRLRRMGQKKAPFYRIIVADSRSPEMVDSSRKSEPTTPAQSPALSRLTRSWQRSGLQTEHSLLSRLESFSRQLASKNKLNSLEVAYEGIS